MESFCWDIALGGFVARQDIAFASQKLSFLRRSQSQKLRFCRCFASLKGRTYGSYPAAQCQKIKKSPKGRFLIFWYARQDSNLRPFAPQANALSSWATGTRQLFSTNCPLGTTDACVDVQLNNIHLEINEHHFCKWQYYYNIFLDFVWNFA